MKWMIGVLLLTMITVVAEEIVKEEQTSNFKEVVIRNAGKLSGNFKNGQMLQKLEGGVDLTFVGHEAANSIDVKSKSIDFEYADTDEDTPSKMVLTGNVIIKNGEMTVKSPKAIIDLVVMRADFIGKSEIKFENGDTAFADSIQVDLETGEIELTKFHAEKIDLMKMKKK